MPIASLSGRWANAAKSGCCASIRRPRTSSRCADWAAVVQSSDAWRVYCMRGSEAGFFESAMAQRVAGGLEQGSFRLFRAAGIDVFVHWTWLLVAFFAVQNRGKLYDSKIWNVIEYVSLFGIVLLHEFGHALA